MIIFKSSKGEIYNLFTKPKHLIGRCGDLVLDGDKSVSREHAIISISVKNGNPKIVLQDLMSKYGTFINDGITTSKEITKNNPIVLNVGDKIRFGQQWNTWTIEESQIVICTLALQQNEKNALRNIVSSMNGILVSDWSENCTHLTINNIKMTAKVVCALGSAKPIVSEEYWKTLKSVLSSRVEKPLVDCDDFVPLVEDTSIKHMRESFKMKYCRRNLLKGIRFIAFNTGQYKSIQPMVSAAGGSVFDGTVFQISDSQLINEKVLVLQNNTDEASSSSYSKILNCLERHQLRPIADSEISLSLLHCSLEQYCNPAYDVSILLQQRESQVTIKEEATILALESQNFEGSNTQFQESESSKFSLTVNEQRVFSDSEDENEDVVHDTNCSVNVGVSTKANNTDRKKTLFASIKRKFNDTSENSTAKNSKLDNWLNNKVPRLNNSEIINNNNNSSDMSSCSAVNKKSTKDLFVFPNDKKPCEKSSSSLFSNLSKRISDEKTADKSSNVSENKKFILNSEKDSVNTMNISEINKRKRSSDDDLSLGKHSSTSKKMNLERKKLFDFTSVNRNSKNKLSASLFDSENSDSNDSFLEETSKLTVSKTAEEVPRVVPAVIPTRMSLSQFVDASTNSNNVEIKTEPLELSTLVQEVLNKTVVHTLSMVKEKFVKNVLNENVNNGVVNFKKFKKNNQRQRPIDIISTEKLCVYGGRSQNTWPADNAV